MRDRPEDPRWPKLLSLSVHELRTPMTVVAGYIRMLLKDRAGPLADQQRRLLEEAEKSCARLSSLLAEMSDLGAIEGGKATFNKASLDLATLLPEAVSSLPAVPDRDIPVTLQVDGPLPMTGDPVRLRTALASVMHALRRELVTTPELVVRASARDIEGRRSAWIAIADPEHIDALNTADLDTLTTFDEWRGGVGLSLAVARRVFNAHDGTILSAAEGTKTAAAIVLPLV